MQSFAVSFCDIDGLKYVNDTLGHEEGDWYIVSIAQAIKENLRDDDFVFAMEEMKSSSYLKTVTKKGGNNFGKNRQLLIV